MPESYRVDLSTYLPNSTNLAFCNGILFLQRRSVLHNRTWQDRSAASRLSDLRRAGVCMSITHLEETHECSNHRPRSARPTPDDGARPTPDDGARRGAGVHGERCLRELCIGRHRRPFRQWHRRAPGASSSRRPTPGIKPGIFRRWPTACSTSRTPVASPTGTLLDRTAQSPRTKATVSSSVDTDPLTQLDTPRFTLSATANSTAIGMLYTALGNMLTSGSFCFWDSNTAFDGTSASCTGAGSLTFTLFYDLIVHLALSALPNSAYAEINVLGTGVPNGILFRLRVHGPGYPVETGSVLHLDSKPDGWRRRILRSRGNRGGGGRPRTRCPEPCGARPDRSRCDASA